jgi:hypothetical protein
MTSSPDTPGRAERSEREKNALPPALPSMWRLCKLGYRHEPGLMLAAFVLALLSALPDALLALWLKLLGQGVLEHGKVIELGTHDELMALGGRYQTMFDLQAQRFTEAEDEEGAHYDVLA